jgi:hypothetical protein
MVLAKGAVGVVSARAVVAKSPANAIDVVLELIDPDYRCVCISAGDVGHEIEREQRCGFQPNVIAVPHGEQMRRETPE